MSGSTVVLEEKIFTVAQLPSFTFPPPGKARQIQKRYYKELLSRIHESGFLITQFQIKN